jgi:hypothetical protein
VSRSRGVADRGEVGSRALRGKSPQQANRRSLLLVCSLQSESHMRKIFGYVLMTAAAALGTACSQTTDDHGLAAARDRWTKQAPGEYRFTWRRSCECPTEMTRPIEIRVTGRQITSAVYVDDRSAVAEQFRSSLRTIEGVFDDLEMAIDQRTAEINLSFDPALGYPTSVFVDYSRQIADEELALQIASLTPTVP